MMTNDDEMISIPELLVLAIDTKFGHYLEDSERVAEAAERSADAAERAADATERGADAVERIATLLASVIGMQVGTVYKRGGGIGDFDLKAVSYLRAGSDHSGDEIAFTDRKK